jgi:hypothetical protein
MQYPESDVPKSLELNFVLCRYLKYATLNLTTQPTGPEDGHIRNEKLELCALELSTSYQSFRVQPGRGYMPWIKPSSYENGG